MTQPRPTPAAPTDAPLPWWHHGHVWLLIAGPAIVVVAGFVTLWLAMRSPDPVISDDYYRRGIEINKALEKPGEDKSLLPALQGRNHAATPQEDVPARKP